MRVSDYIADFIYEQGVTHVFEVIGGMTTYLIDSLYRNGKVKIISVHHEQAAAFAAESFSRVKGIPGIAFATSGPGAINLLTGIGSCYYDSYPAVFITGQVNRNEMKMERSIRQLGFQEADIVTMACPITKAAWCIADPESVPHIMERAFRVALSGRPGPVLLDIPMDIQHSDIVIEPPKKVTILHGDDLNNSEIQLIIDKLKSSKKPLVIAGGGLRSSNMVQSFREFIERTKLPVVNSLMGVDVLPYSNPLRIGMIGTYGNRWANKAIGESDLLLVLGSRLDIRQTGSEVKAFKDERTIFHVDCDISEVNNRVIGCVPIVSQLNKFFSQILNLINDVTFPDWSGWCSEILKVKQIWPDTNEVGKIKGINPNIFMHSLAQYSSIASAYAVDVGQNQMWAAQSLELKEDQRFITSGGMGALGSALPYAIGVAFAIREKPVMVIAGDGGFQLNIQELQTVTHYNLPIKIVIINNKSYGMVRQFQQSYFDSRYQSTIWGYSEPDFVKIARAYNINGQTITNNSEIESGLIKLWENPLEPFLLNVIIDTEANVYPKTAFGEPITKMEPLEEFNR